MSDQVLINAQAGAGPAALPSATAVADQAPAADPARQAAAVNDSLAAELREMFEGIKDATDTFPVPGWNGRLEIEVKQIHDRKELENGLTNEQLIAHCTKEIRFRRKDETELTVVQGGWQALGALVGLPPAGVALVIRGVLANPLRLDGFAEDVLAFVLGRKSAIQEALGE